MAVSVLRSAATTRIPPVTSSSMRSVRRTVASTPVIPAVIVTGPMRAATSRADSGNVVESPDIVWPGCTRKRSVPRASMRAMTSARLDDEMPTTATIAAIPMAIPSAVSSVRNRRERKPGDRGAGEVDGGAAGWARSSCRDPLVVDHHAVAQRHAARRAARRSRGRG